MASIFAEIAQEALAVTNDVMGVPCVYGRDSDNSAVDNVMVIINKNKKVTDEFKTFVGYRNEANFLKSQYPHQPEDGDIITEPNGTEWRVGVVTIETDTKWYVDVRRR